MNYGRTDGSRIMVTKMFDKEGNEESLRELDQAPEKKRVFIEIDG
jgi:hypothetical protein